MPISSRFFDESIAFRPPKNTGASRPDCSDGDGSDSPRAVAEAAAAATANIGEMSVKKCGIAEEADAALTWLCRATNDGEVPLTWLCRAADDGEVPLTCDGEVSLTCDDEARFDGFRTAAE